MAIPQDPILLVSYLNTQLRDHYPSLFALCEDLALDRTALCEKLENAGFAYQQEQNQFR